MILKITRGTFKKRLNSQSEMQIFFSISPFPLALMEGVMIQVDTNIEFN